MQNSTPHSFHIPVMGLAFTVDTPIKVARYGISSVISIIEDNLIELMRRHYYAETNRPYVHISPREEDYRARRITDYLNLVNDIVKDQVKHLRGSPFDAGSDIVKYFEMLPDQSELRQLYQKMSSSKDTREREALQTYLRSRIKPGSIDVNIMTKVDKNNFDKTGNALPDGSDAVSALRGYINSDLTDSSIIFSAGLNPRLFNYMEKVSAFNAKDHGVFDKKVVIKVSDYRSALIQGKYLAKKGIWVSEFRIESGLNCGGHAFATDGTLLGPILEEFKTKEKELTGALHSLYNPVVKEKGGLVFDQPHPVKISVQGGIGTHEEAKFLTDYYGVTSTGWGTPFLLCPEATTVDQATLKLLSEATEKDIVLSKNSPLGVRFNYLKGTSSEKEKLMRIKKGRPGSPCTEKHLVSNTEFSKDPICTASHTYQKQKIEQLQSLGLPAEEYEKQYNQVVSKECLCIGLMNSAVHTYNLPPVKKLEAVTICPGPNIAYFSKVVSLREITDHIYGRANILSHGGRPHMFIKELHLNIDYLKEQIQDIKGKNEKIIKEISGFGDQLLKGIEYYRSMAGKIVRSRTENFIQQLNGCESGLKKVMVDFSETVKLE
ncbi:MAG TPA: hypothetical protein VFO54_02185, partial [Chryseosolibacter sp.]|nr:hypothetical protein [Chryseosolibacter sp.]